MHTHTHTLGQMLVFDPTVSQEHQHKEISDANQNFNSPTQKTHKMYEHQ